MNRIYKVIWSKVKHQYVVVSELAHSCTKSAGSRVGRSAAAVLAALVLTTGLCAAPVQAEDLTDPYALLNVQVEETNSTSSDTLVTLVQSPLVKSVAPLANEDEGQPGEGGSSTVTTPDGQHTIYNEEGFYAHNGQGTYNSLTKDGLFVGGTDNGEGLYVDNDGNIYTDGNAEIEGSFSAADGNATIAADGTTVIRAGGSQLVVKDGAAGITHGNAIMAVSSNKAEMQGGGSSVIADLNGVTLTERTGNTTVTVNQDGMTVGGDFAVTGNTNLKHTNVDGDLNVSGSTHVDGGLTAGNLQTEGQLHARSAVIDGSATVGGKLTAGDVKTNTVDAHNVSVDNELTAGKATIDGKLTAGSAEITNSATVGGTLTAGDIETEGTVKATNADITNLEAGKATVDGKLTAGSADITGDAVVGGKLTAGDVKTNTVDAHNVSVDNELTAGKATIDGKLAAGSAEITNSATVGGTLTAGDIETEGTVTATNADITNLEAGKATVDGKLTAGSADITGDAVVGGKLTAGDVKTNTVDAHNVSVDNELTAGKATIDGKLTAGSVSVTYDATVGGNLSVTGATTLTGALTANGTATFTQGASMNNQKITGVLAGKEGTDAVNKDQLDAVEGKIKTYTAGDGIDITSDEISVKSADNNIVVDGTGVSLADDINVTSVTTTGAANVGGDLSVTGTTTLTGALTANGAATFTQGASMNNQKITGVLAGKEGTDAVNKDQLDAVEGKIKTYTAGDGIDITSDEISVKSADNNIVVDGTGVSLADDINVTSVTTTGAANVGGDLSVNGTTTLTGALTANGAATFTQGASMNGQKITGVATGVDGKDAVNVDQLNAAIATVDGEVYTEGNGIDIDEADNNKISVKAAADGNLEVDSTGVSLKDNINLTSVTTSGAVKVGGDLGVTGTTTLTGALTANGAATFTQGASMNNQKITGVLAGKEGTDAVNKDQLDAVEGKIKTYTAGDGIDITSDEISVKSADNNIVVDGTGVSLADDINVTSVTTTGAANVGGDLSVNGTTTLTGALTANGAATFMQGASMNGQKITGVATGVDGKDAVNVDQLNAAIATVDGEVYTEGNGIDIDEADNNKISVKAAADGNLEVDSTGVSLKDNINLTSVTTSGAVKVGGDLGVTGTTTLTGALTANGAATFTQGASMNNQKITGVLAGKEGTDAVNKDQLDAVEGKIKTYTAGDGIDITSDEISVKSADNNIVVDGTGVSLADDISVTSVATTGAANVGGNLSVAGTTTLTGATTINSTLGVTGAVTAASVTAAGGFTINDSNSLTSSGLKIGGTQYITSAGLNAGNKVITNVSPGNNPTDAVNMSQLSEIKEVSDLAVTYRNEDKQAVDLAANGGTGTTITNVANGTLSETSKDAINGGQLYATNQIVGDGDYSSNNFLIDSTAPGGMDLTKAASALDKAIGNNHYTGNGVLETNTTGQNYGSITDAVSALDLKIGNLTFTEQNVLKGKQSSVTTALSTLNEAIGSLDFKNGMNYIASGSDLTQAARTLDTTISAVANAVGVRLSEEGGLSTTIDWTDSSISQGETVVGAIKNIDGRVTKLETASNALSTFSRSNISTLSALSNMDMSAVNTLSSLSADDLAAISTLSEDGSVPAANSDPNSRPGRGPSSGSEDSSTHDGESQTMDHDLNVTGDVSVGGTLDVTGEANFGSNVNVSGDLDVQGETNMHGTLNMNDNKITGVTAGEISATSTDAVNGSQLWQTNQQVAANTENIGILGSAVNKLGDRIERVGAGAAALAALHPLDFDPDNKLDFAAGFGNYRGASAVAVGAFYRPSENVMFSVGGAFGGGEDMVNAGVSFKVGAGSGSATTSRTAMAKSLKSMQEVVASQDAQLAQQREQIDKLTAMVELLMEQNGQAQPKDGDAQAAQPQQ